MATRDAEWDAVWAEYDRREQHVISGSAPIPAPRGRRLAALLALLAVGLLLILSYGMRVVPAASGREAPPASLSPVEADLPPLSATITRLATESLPAACWAMRLRPQGGDCPLPAR